MLEKPNLRIRSPTGPTTRSARIASPAVRPSPRSLARHHRLHGDDHAVLEPGDEVADRSVPVQVHDLIDDLRVHLVDEVVVQLDDPRFEVERGVLGLLGAGVWMIGH